MNLSAWLISMVGPVVARVLVSMGLSVVTLVGFGSAVLALKNVVTSNIGSMPAAAVQLLGLFGAWEALGMIFGTLTFIVTWRVTASSWALAKV